MRAWPIVLFLLSGCASSQMVSWEGRQFTLTCSRGFGAFKLTCSDETWEKEAKTVCPSGTLTQIGGGMIRELARSTGTVSSSGDVSLNHSYANAQYRTYECRHEP